MGAVALEIASQLPTAESSQVYTCSADDNNNQHCTMLSTDDQLSWYGFAAAVVFLATILSIAFYYLMGIMHRW